MIKTSEMTSAIYKTLLKIYKISPFKRLTCLILKGLKISNSKFYKDLKFLGQFKVDVNNSNSFKLYHHGGNIENETYWKGLFQTWENDTGWIWLELCKFSETIFDIGANTGIYSVTAKSINPDSDVYAFEPSNNTYNKLLLNNSLNDFDITCEKIALSNHNGNKIFYDTPDSNQTSASLSPEKLKNWDGYSGEISEYEVQTMELSNYIKNKSICKIDLMKIDIEMHEPEAIEGLGSYLLKFKPIIIVEVLSEAVADKLNNLIDTKNHTIFHLKGEENSKLVEEFSLQPPFWNYLIFHKDLTEKIKSNTTLFKKN